MVLQHRNGQRPGAVIGMKMKEFEEADVISEHSYYGGEAQR